MATYVVVAIPKHPAWDERDGIRFEIEARTRALAIRYARRRLVAEGYSVRTGGPATFRASLKREA